LAAARRPIWRIHRACGMFEVMCSSRVGEQYGDHYSQIVNECVCVWVRQRIAVGYQPSHVAINCEIFYTSKPKGSTTITENVLEQLRNRVYAQKIYWRPSFCPTGSPSYYNRMNMISRIVIILYYYTVLRTINITVNILYFYRCI